MPCGREIRLRRAKSLRRWGFISFHLMRSGKYHNLQSKLFHRELSERFHFLLRFKTLNIGRGACRGVRVSGGDLCTKCRSTDRAGRRDQVLLPLPKKAPIFRCFFLLFTAIYGDFTCFFHIDKTTAHGLFRTPIFHFRTVFCSLCATQSMQFVWYIIKKASITIQIR